MSQLIIVVLSIALAALLVAGGTNYMNPDMGLRAQSTERIVADYRLIEGAIASYRIANRGARPTPATVGTPIKDQAWRREIQDFLPQKFVPVINGFEWYYLEDNGRILCLTTSAAAEKTMLDFMKIATGKVASATMEVDCLGIQTTGANRSIIFPLK